MTENQQYIAKDDLYRVLEAMDIQDRPWDALTAKTLVGRADWLATDHASAIAWSDILAQLDGINQADDAAAVEEQMAELQQDPHFVLRQRQVLAIESMADLAEAQTAILHQQYLLNLSLLDAMEPRAASRVRAKLDQLTKEASPK